MRPLVEPYATQRERWPRTGRHIRALRLGRTAFEAILQVAVPSSVGQTPRFATPAEWQAAVAQSSVRLQWDPDHHPSRAALECRAIQLGLRGETLRRFAQEWIMEVEDVSAFVAEQRRHVLAGRVDQLLTPREDVYPIVDPNLAARLSTDPWPP